MCDHNRTLFLSAYSRDCNFARLEVDGEVWAEGDGYVPRIPGLHEYADYLKLTICLDCKTVLDLDDLDTQEVANSIADM